MPLTRLMVLVVEFGSDDPYSYHGVSPFGQEATYPVYTLFLHHALAVIDARLSRREIIQVRSFVHPPSRGS